MDMVKQESFVQRMVEEQKELKTKLVKLNKFIADKQVAELDEYNRSLLLRQREAMVVYFETLTARIALNEKD